jgi:hypothetical protein
VRALKAPLTGKPGVMAEGAFTLGFLCRETDRFRANEKGREFPVASESRSLPQITVATCTSQFLSCAVPLNCKQTLQRHLP